MRSGYRLRTEVQNLHKKITALLSMLVLLFVISPASFGSELKVIVSIKPVHSLLSGLMIGADKPELIVEQGKTPYGYVLSQQQKDRIATADLIVWVGPELETFLSTTIETPSFNTRVFTILDSQELKILPSRWREGTRDPFFWHDSRNALILIDELTKLLIEMDPGRAHLYQRNRNREFDRLAELDRRLEYGYRGLKKGAGLAYYDTLQYFEQAYALKITGVVAESPRFRSESAGKTS